MSDIFDFIKLKVGTVVVAKSHAYERWCDEPIPSNLEYCVGHITGFENVYNKIWIKVLWWNGYECSLPREDIQTHAELIDDEGW